MDFLSPHSCGLLIARRELARVCGAGDGSARIHKGYQAAALQLYERLAPAIEQSGRLALPMPGTY